MIKLNLCGYIDTSILAKGTIKVPITAAQGAAVNNTNENAIFKNCALFARYQLHDRNK